MAEFNQSALTKKGAALVAKAQSDGATIRITKAVVGSGTYDGTEDLTALTELKHQEQEFTPSSIERKNDTNVFVHFTISNYNEVTKTGLDHGYFMTEMGLIAEDPDEGEILYAISTAAQADWLQSYNGYIPATVGVHFLVEVSNASEVQITTDLEA